MSRHKYNLFLFFILSLCISCAGTYFSNAVVYPLSKYPFLFTGVSRDEWSSEKFSIDLKEYLPPEGGAVSLQFIPWRPGSVPPLKNISVSVCGKKESFAISEANYKIDILAPSTDQCNQRKIDFFIDSPFVTKDKRTLGVKVTGVSFKGLLKNINITFVGVLTLSLFIACVLSFYAFHWPGAWVVLLTSIWVLTHQFWDVRQEVFMFFVLSGFVSLGAIIHFKDRFASLSLSLVTCILALIIVSAFYVRMYGLDFGLPHYFHPDETRKGRIALRFIETGNFDPEYFLHPTLLLYLTAFVGKIRNMLFDTPLTIQELVHSGRMVSVIAGVSSVVSVFFIAKRLISKEAGLIASGLVAFSPLTVTCSRYLKEDSLVLSLLLLSILFALNAKENKHLYSYSFLVAGISMSAKYSGLLSMIPVFMTAFIFDRKYLLSHKMKFFFMPLLFVAGFLLCSPYIVLNNQKFIEDFLSEGKHMVDGHHDVIISPFDHFFLYHMVRSVIPAFGGFAVGGILVGAFLLSIGHFIKKPTFTIFYVLFLAGLFYLPGEMVNAKPPPQAERYILPTIPFMAISAASLLLRVRGGMIVSSLCILFLAIKSTLFAFTLVPDTREIMGQWMTQNLPQGSVIAIDASPYTPLLSDKFTVKNLGAFEERRALSPETLTQEGIQYLLVTSLSYERYFHTRNSDQIIKERFKEIFSTLPLVHEVVPSRGTYGFHNPKLLLYKVEPFVSSDVTTSN